MNAIETVKKISSHYIVTHEMPLQIQLGLPFLEKKNDSLYMSFKAHKELMGKDSMDFYEPQYTLVFKYPFKHVVKFEQLDINGSPTLITSVDNKTMLTNGKFYIKELYDACTRVLECWEKDGTVSDLIISKYKEQFKKTVESLNLEGIYF